MKTQQKIKLAEKIFAEINQAILETKSMILVDIRNSQFLKKLKLIEEKWTK